jgi:phospholipase/carboxylesterase
VRWVFPAAPLALAGVYGAARAWWMLDLARLERDLARGDAAVRRDEVPDGLLPARAQLLRLLDEVVARFGDGPIILGGFSQGSMLALDVALHRAAPLAGLVLMSTTLINAGDWLPRLPGLRGVPVIQSHGRADGLLPFAVADGLRALLVEAGAEITWQPFDGGHEIPGETIDAIGALLGRVG